MYIYVIPQRRWYLTQPSTDLSLHSRDYVIPGDEGIVIQIYEIFKKSFILLRSLSW